MTPDDIAEARVIAHRIVEAHSDKGSTADGDVYRLCDQLMELIDRSNQVDISRRVQAARLAAEQAVVICTESAPAYGPLRHAFQIVESRQSDVIRELDAIARMLTRPARDGEDFFGMGS